VKANKFAGSTSDSEKQIIKLIKQSELNFIYEVFEIFKVAIQHRKLKVVEFILREHQSQINRFNLGESIIEACG
jgi:hypothetical protein